MYGWQTADEKSTALAASRWSVRASRKSADLSKRYLTAGLLRLVRPSIPAQPAASRSDMPPGPWARARRNSLVPVLILRPRWIALCSIATDQGRDQAADRPEMPEIRRYGAMLCLASAPRIVPIRAESRIILAPMGAKPLDPAIGGNPLISAMLVCRDVPAPSAGADQVRSLRTQPRINGVVVWSSPMLTQNNSASPQGIADHIRRST
jgi:hypothetical protein